MNPEEIYNNLRHLYTNVIPKNDRIWILEDGDLYVLRIKNGKIHIRRNWWNPYLLLFVALFTYLAEKIIIHLSGLTIETKHFWTIFLLLYSILILLNARNNKHQKQIIKRIKKDVENSSNPLPD